MNDINTRLHTFSLTPGIQPRAASPQPAASQPKESFSSGDTTPPWLRKPSIEANQAEKPNPAQKQGMSAGKKLALAACCLAGGAGLAGGVMMRTPATPVLQVQTLNHQQQKSLENLRFLNQVGHNEEGGLKIDGTSLMDQLTHTQREASPERAFQALTNGSPVYFWESGGDEPVTITSFDQLKEVSRDLHQRIAETKLQQAGEDIKEGFKNLGHNISDSAQDFGHKVGNIFR